jgi:hypothetical protein
MTDVLRACIREIKDCQRTLDDTLFRLNNFVANVLPGTQIQNLSQKPDRVRPER